MIKHSSAKKILTTSALALTLVASSVMGLIPVRALALGETWHWDSWNTITVTGGSLTQPSTVWLSQSGQQLFTFSAQYHTKFTGGPYSGQPCIAYGSVAFDPGGSQRLLHLGGGEGASQGPGSIPNCYQYTPAGLTSGTVTTDNDWPKGGLSSGSVFVEVDASGSAWTEQKQIYIQLKTADGKLIPGGQVKADQGAGGAYQYQYVGAFDNVKKGSYQACVASLPPFQNPAKPCSSFTVNTFPYTETLKFGKTYDNPVRQIINGTVELKGAVVNDPQSDQVFGPYIIQLKNSSGSVVASKSVSHTYKAGSGCTGQGGCFSTFNFFMNYSMDNIKAGKYQLCVLGTSVCKSITKAPNVTLQAPQLVLTGDDIVNGQGGAGATDSDPCAIPDGALRWIACPVSTAMQTFTNYLSGVIQSLLTTPTGQIFNSNFKQAWNVFRGIGIALIVIAGLVMVISQAAGLEIFDAYTIRKVMPRLLIAAIGMSLSWPLLKYFVTFFNDIGNWAHDLILTPFQASQSHFSSVSAVMNYLVLGVGGAAALINLAFLGPVGVLALIGTILLAALIGVFVLVLRQLIILVAVLLAPLAIASFILPGTQKLWKFWRETLVTTLAMFPIIMAFLASGQALAYVANSTDSKFEHILAVIIYFVPYVMLPFAFKLAGGLMSTIFSLANDHTKGGFDRLRNARKKQRETRGGYYKQRYGDQLMQKRADIIRGLNQSASGKTGFSRGIRRLGAGALSPLGGIEDKMSAITARQAKVFGDEKDYGRDDRLRGLTTDMSMGFEQAVLDGKAREYKGRRQWKTLGGAWVDEEDALEGHRLWDKDVAMQQHALGYEISKANTEEEVQGIVNNYKSLAKNQWRNSDTQAAGSWKGATFNNQNQHLELKHTDWEGKMLKRDENGVLGGGFVEEIFEKKGSYPLAQMHAETIRQLQVAYKDAEDRGDTVTMEKIAGISETFMSRYGAGGGGAGEEAEREDAERQANVIRQQMVQEGLDVNSAAGQQEVERRLGGSYQAHTPGAAHVAQRVVELAQMTGRYRQVPRTPDSPTGPTYPNVPPQS